MQVQSSPGLKGKVCVDLIMVQNSMVQKECFDQVPQERYWLSGNRFVAAISLHQGNVGRTFLRSHKVKEGISKKYRNWMAVLGLQITVELHQGPKSHTLVMLKMIHLQTLICNREIQIVFPRSQWEHSIDCRI